MICSCSVVAVACRKSHKDGKVGTCSAFKSQGLILLNLSADFFFSILSAILYFALDAQLIHPLWQDMSSEVVDSNPYSRLMALQRMGIVENYERIREFSVAIVVSINALFFFYFSFI